MSYFYNEKGLNSSWWFISLLLVLYFLFPLLHKIIKKWPLETVAFSFLLFVTPYISSKNLFFDSILRCFLLKSYTQGYITQWLTSFILGIAIDRLNFFENIKSWQYKTKTILFIITFVTMIFTRRVLIPVGISIIDALIALNLIILIWIFIRGNFFKGMAFLGKHSANIYIIHTYIYLFYFKDFSYALKYPPLILVQLITVCLIFSIVFEKFKEYIRIIFNKLREKHIKKTKIN